MRQETARRGNRQAQGEPQRSETMKLPTLGSVWIARATCYDSAGQRIGYCIDTPNGIAKAMLEHTEIYMAKGLAGYSNRTNMRDRMAAWNVAESHYCTA
jgi:hypothetical protein